MHPIRKKLTRDVKYNPFHDEYDEAAVLALIKEKSKNKDLSAIDNKLLISLITTLYLNPIYKDAYKYLKTNLFESGLEFIEILEFSISAVNRNLIVTNGIIRKESSNSTEQNYIDILKHKINSSDSSIGKINTQAALESSLDSLHIIINYAKHFKDIIPEKQPNTDDIKTIEKIKRLSFAATLYYITKTEYDQCIWNDGYTSIDKDKNTFIFKYESTTNLILKKIGFFRLQRNSFGMYIMGKELLETDKAQPFIDSFRQNKYPVKIESTSINDGFILFKLDVGIDMDELDYEIKNNSEFLSYYNFIDNAKLPKLDNLTLKDVIILFDTLQHLFRKASDDFNGDDSILTLNGFKKFPFKITVNILLNYLLARTKYSKVQINQFLDLLTNKEDKRVNFWDYPLLRQGDYYTFPLITIINPITLVLAEKWLEDGGFDIDSRGKYFENIINESIKSILLAKGYQFTMPNNPIYKLDKKKFEEIDFIVNLKNICVIAEIKCIKFSMGPRDEHNALKRLTEGVKQVKRKSNFIQKHHLLFKNRLGDIKNKEIINIVITNFPTFSGYNIDGVAIVDFFLFESYFKSGKITNLKISSENGTNIVHENISEIIAYNNEDEFCANLNGHMINPTAIEILKDEFEVKRTKISPEGMGYKMYVESVDYK